MKLPFVLAPLLAAGCGSVANDAPPAPQPDAGMDAPDDGPAADTLWTFSYGDSSTDAVQCARLAADGHVILLGEATGTVTIGGTEITTPPGGGASLFVTRLDDGVARTPTVMHGQMPHPGANCDADATGRLAIAGTLTRGTATFGTQTVNTPDNYRGYHALFTANDALQWVKTSGALETYGGAATLDDAGNFYVAHLFTGNSSLGGTTFNAASFDALFGKRDAVK